MIVGDGIMVRIIVGFWREFVEIFLTGCAEMGTLDRVLWESFGTSVFSGISDDNGRKKEGKTGQEVSGCHSESGH